MRKKTIYLIRHGETEYNRKGAVQGRGIDSDLNETGRKQALAFYHSYKKVTFDKVYVSNLVRTYQTAECFIMDGIPYEKSAGLDEISWGRAEGLTLAQLERDIFVNLLNKWRNGNLDAALENGESPNDVVKRLKVVVDKIIHADDEEQILVTLHGRTLRILLCYLMDHPLENMEYFEHSNTCLYILEYDYETAKFKVKLKNDTRHLQLMDKPFNINQCR